jgi:hypothetical protein
VGLAELPQWHRHQQPATRQHGPPGQIHRDRHPGRRHDLLGLRGDLTSGLHRERSLQLRHAGHRHLGLLHHHQHLERITNTPERITNTLNTSSLIRAQTGGDDKRRSTAKIRTVSAFYRWSLASGR